MNKRVQVK